MERYKCGKQRKDKSYLITNSEEKEQVSNKYQGFNSTIHAHNSSLLS